MLMFKNNNKVSAAKAKQNKPLPCTPLPVDAKDKKWTFKSILLLIGLILVLKGAEFLYFSSSYGTESLAKTEKVIRSVLTDSGFTVKEAFVRGNIRTDLKQILRVSGIVPNTLIFDADINRINKNIQRLPWVEKVYVSRQLPDTIKIDLQEYTPIALWQKNGIYYPISSDGKVLSDKAKSPDLKKLPIVTGIKAPEKLPALLDELQAVPTLAWRIKAFMFINEKRWDIIFDSVDEGIRVSLPEINIKESLKRLEAYEENHKLLKRKLTLIDLRLPDKLIVRLENSQKSGSFNAKRNGKKKSVLVVKEQKA